MRSASKAMLSMRAASVGNYSWTRGTQAALFSTSGIQWAATPSKGSRFSARAPSGISEAEAAAGSVDLIADPKSVTSAKAFQSQCVKVKADYLTSPTPSAKGTILAALTSVNMDAITDCDVETISAFLQALQSVEAPGNSKVIDTCGHFVVKNYKSISSGQLLANVVHSFVKLKYTRVNDLLHILSKSVEKSLQEGQMNSKSAAMVFAAYASMGPRGAGTTQEALSKLRSEMASFNVSDGITVLQALATARTHLSEQESQALLVEMAYKIQESAAMLTSAQVAEVLSAIASFQHDKLHGLGMDLVGKLSVYSLDIATISMLLDVWADRQDTNLGASIQNTMRPRLTELLAGSDLTKDDLADLAFATKGKDAEVLKKFAVVVEALADKAATQDAEKASDDLSFNSAKVLKAALRYLNATNAQGSMEKIASLINLVLNDAHPPPVCVAAVLQTEELLIQYNGQLKQCFTAGTKRWTLNDYEELLQSLSHGEAAHTAEARDLSRLIGGAVGDSLKVAPATTLVSILGCYGALRVRHDAFCSAAVDRVLQLKKEFSGSEISHILGSFMRMDFRQPKVFTELAVPIRGQIHTLSGPEVAVVAAAFSKMLLWNYKLFSKLADHAVERRSEMTLDDISLLLTAFYRVQWKQDTTFHEFLNTIKARLTSGSGPGMSRTDSLKILTAFSRLHIFDEALYDRLAQIAMSSATAEAPLSGDEVGAILLGFARVDGAHRKWFDELKQTALNVVPTSGPLALADISTAYAVCEVKHEELFSLVADRLLAIKLDCPAITIASVLVAFAKVGVRNDKLFIDVIPRVRYVAHHGSATDVVNVLTAYSLTGLWHYKLFTRLGDRAVLLRSDFTAPMITALLAAYAKIEMKYDKVFVEFSPKIQSILHWFIGAELVSVLQSFAAVKMNDLPLFNAIIERCAAIHGELDQELQNDLINVCFKLSLPTNTLAAVGIKAVEEKKAEASA